MSVRNGDTVFVHYVGTLADGTEFDRSRPERPLSFKVGTGQVISGFENAVLGREKGDRLMIAIPPDMAYGEHDEQLVFPVARAEVPPNLDPEVGMPLHIATDQGELEVIVSGMDDENICLDANHPMAGKTLTFDLTVVDIK